MIALFTGFAWAGEPEVVPAGPAPADPPDVATAALAEQYPVLYAGQVKPGDPHFDLEIVYFEARYEDGLKLVEQQLAANPKDAELYWMKVRFMYEIGEKFAPHDASIDKIAWYQEMIDTAEAGLKLAPGHVHLRFGRGIAMGRLGTTRGVLSSLFMAKDVETDWLASAAGGYVYSSLGGREMLPCDAYHALGMYYRLVPDWWIVQAIAGTRGSLDKSLDYSLKAVRCKPDEIDNWKELAVTQLCLGERRKDPVMTANGVQSLRKALTLPTPFVRNQIDHRHSQMILDDQTLACEYSRDGQQDLDEGKLKQ